MENNLSTNEETMLDDIVVYLVKNYNDVWDYNCSLN